MVELTSSLMWLLLRLSVKYHVRNQTLSKTGRVSFFANYYIHVQTMTLLSSIIKSAVQTKAKELLNCK